MTVQLWGFPISNFYNKVKLALLFKGIDFSEERTAPSREEDYLRKSPLGKIPYLQVGEHIIYESQPIIEYLEEEFPDTPLYPVDKLDRARCRSLTQIVDLYIDPALRRLDFGRNLERFTDHKIETEKAHISFAIGALERQGVFTPYLAGAAPTVPDCSAGATLTLVRHYMDDEDLRRELFQNAPKTAAYVDTLTEVPEVKKTLRAMKAALRAQKMRKA